MVDWNGLFKWSMEYQDGTAPSQFKAMSDEDKKWLEEAMKQYTFSDTDRLKEVIDQLVKWNKLFRGEPLDEEEDKDMKMGTDDQLVALLEEMDELAEIHPRNNLNVCLMGGMSELLFLCFKHPSERVRRQTCVVLTAIVANNIQVQDFANKSGAINLVGQFEQEKTMKMKECVFGALAMYIKAENFEGKRRFITDFDGLNFISKIVAANKDPWTGEEYTHKLALKAISLLYDLVLNDDDIFVEDPRHCRSKFSTDVPLISRLCELIDSDKFSHKESQIRSYALRIMFRLHQANPEHLTPICMPVLYKQRSTLDNAIRDKQNEEIKELLEEELFLVDEAIAAPTRPFTKNFDNATQQEKQAQKGDAPRVTGFSLKN